MTPETTHLGQRFAWERGLLAFRDPRVTTTTKVVGLALATHVNAARGTAWPGVALLAQECDLSERATRKHLKILSELGVIEQRGASHGAARRATEWALVPSGWTSPSGTPVPVGSDDEPSPTGTPVPVGEGPKRHLTTSQPAPDDIPTGTGVPLNTKENTNRTTSGGPQQEDQGSGDDDLSDDHRAEVVVLGLRAAQSTEAVAAVRAASLWAFERPYVEAAYLARLDQLDPVPDFLR